MSVRLAIGKTAILIGVALLASFAVPAGSAPSRLEEADQNLQRAMELIAAAETPRANPGAFERYRQNALAHCREARAQLRLVTQAPFIPPGVLPQR